MTRADLIAFETFVAKTYRREASSRRKNPELAAQLVRWAEASDARVTAMRAGPLFEAFEPVVERIGKAVGG